MSTTSQCPACGSNEKGYYCANCNQYWCLSLRCPNCKPFIMKYGRYEEVNDFSICQKCGRKGKER